MAITTLDPRTALIIIDLQAGILALPTAHPSGEILARAAELAETFRRHQLPVVLVNVAGAAPGRTEQAPRPTPPAGWSDLSPLLNRQPQDHLVTKRTWGAFSQTDLEAWLRKEGVTQVVIAGISTSIGVESTARQAQELGFNVALAIDAMTDTNADAHANSITRIFPRLGETGCCAEILTQLQNHSALPRNATEVVKVFWQLMQSNDFDAVSAILAPEFVLEWPQTQERIRGAKNFAQMNAEYPAHGRWEFTLNHIVPGEAQVVTDVSVTDGVQSARAISFFSVTNGKITRIVEYWPEPYSAPVNRAHLVELMNT